MITSAQEYYNNLWRLGSLNAPSLAILLPGTENIYNIDLNSRRIEAPAYLSVEQDHRAEMIYFVTDRFYDGYDLATTVCVIQYLNKTTNKSGIYAVPFYDINTKSTPEQAKILFPWCIDGLVTEAAGEVEYSVRFYAIDESKKIIYNLNTIPSTSKVLHGLNAQIEDYVRPAIDGYHDLLSQIQALQIKDLYWEIMK